MPSLPPLRAIRPEPEQGDRQPAPYAPVAPAAYQQAARQLSYPRLAPVHQQAQLAPQFSDNTSAQQQLAWRRVKTEADGDAYALHHRQLQSMTQHSSGVYSQHHAALNNHNNNRSPSDDDTTDGRVPASDRWTMAPMKRTTTSALGRSSLSSSGAGPLVLNDDDDDDEGQGEPSSVSKKARRKEQCRVNQANYRKRKRMYENELSGQIKLLADEILELTARKIALNHHSQPFYEDQHEQSEIIIQNTQDPIQSIGEFYYALESAQLELPPMGTQELRYPGLQSLFELQQQEFNSIDTLQLQWLWYREQFAIFHLLVSSSERLDAGDQVIIRISAQLHIQMQDRDQHHRRPTHKTSTESEDHWLMRKLVCPVLQQFEFHAHERVLTQITSEIDWLAGVAAAAQSPPEHTLLLLREFADEVTTSAYYNNTCY